MKKHNAFTLIELIFVIVVMGIIGKFGVEFLAQAYRSFIFSNINNTLQSNSSTAVEFIGARLQHRLKDSIIVRTGEVTSFKSLASASTANNYTVLEWVSSDIDNFRGTTSPNWSGIIDLEHSDHNSSILVSPETNTTAINSLIQSLSHSKSTFDNSAALYFIGSNVDINGYGWNSNAITTQNEVMHPVVSVTNHTDQFMSGVSNFTGIDVYEYYKLAWTANAIVMENYNQGAYAGKNMGDLVFYFNYQPWNGEKFYDGGDVLHYTIMKKVSTFRAIAIGSIIKIQVCTKSATVKDEEYSLCKEKTIF